MPKFIHSGLSSFSFDDIRPQGIIIRNNDAKTSTFSHEMGHYFDLLHTHETMFGKEHITRDESSSCYNAETAGDKLSDTLADPCLYDQQLFNVNENCEYDP